MIRVTIEMVPLGIEQLKRHMATIEIANDMDESLSTDGRRGSYIAKLSRISQKGESLGWYERRGYVRGVNRNQSGAVYRILHGVLDDWLKR